MFESQVDYKLRIRLRYFKKMISHTHKFIFIHIPRTGGSSIERQLIRKKIGSLDKYTKHKTLFSIEKEVNLCEFFKFSFKQNFRTN